MGDCKRKRAHVTTPPGSSLPINSAGRAGLHVTGNQVAYGKQPATTLVPRMGAYDSTEQACMKHLVDAETSLAHLL
jgi:hypothetical protein